MQVKDKIGQRPEVTLNKSEVRRLLEASYLLRRLGLMVEDDQAIEASAAIKQQCEKHAPEWTADPETGDLVRTARTSGDQAIEADADGKVTKWPESEEKTAKAPENYRGY